jgi:hypothetical protein
MYSINFFTFLQKTKNSDFYFYFENFSIPKNNIITVELALFGRDQFVSQINQGSQNKIMASLVYG